MMTDYKLDGWVGQAESAAEFDHAMNAGAKALVGNLSALEDDQKELIHYGEVTFLQEVYRNEDANLVPNLENLPVLVCVGLYPGPDAVPSCVQSARGNPYSLGQARTNASSRRPQLSRPPRCATS